MQILSALVFQINPDALIQGINRRENLGHPLSLQVLKDSIQRQMASI